MCQHGPTVSTTSAAISPTETIGGQGPILSRPVQEIAVPVMNRGDGWAHVTTERLRLDIPTAGDAEELFAIHADPALWRHFPSGVHTDPSTGPQMVQRSIEQFATYGLGYWSMREADQGAAGPVLGRVGCAVGDDLPWWNLYYRLARIAQGKGYAGEAARTAITAARTVEPERPVLAFLLEHNEGSRRTAEAVGLRQIWRGPDLGNPDPDAVRLVYLDREPNDEVMTAIETRFRPA